MDGNNNAGRAPTPWRDRHARATQQGQTTTPMGNIDLIQHEMRAHHTQFGYDSPAFSCISCGYLLPMHNCHFCVKQARLSPRLPVKTGMPRPGNGTTAEDSTSAWGATHTSSGSPNRESHGLS